MMSEKRFTKCCPKMRDNGEEMSCQEVEDMLNQLYKENQELKQLIHTMLMQIDAENIGDVEARYSARIVFTVKEYNLMKKVWNNG